MNQSNDKLTDDDFDFKMDDGHTLCIRASTPRDIYALGQLAGACVKVGMQTDEGRVVGTEDDLELHLPAHWLIKAALWKQSIGKG